MKDCKGPVKYFACLSATYNDELNQEIEEENMCKDKLCESCYWYMTSMNVFMEMHNNEAALNEVYRMLKSLPNGLHIFKCEPNQLLRREMRIAKNQKKIKSCYSTMVNMLADSFEDDAKSVDELKL